MRVFGRSIGALGALLLVAGSFGAAPFVATADGAQAAQPRTSHPAALGDITGIDITLPIGKTISGTITDGSAAPIAGMTISACSTTDQCFSTTTAANGTYTIEGLPPDSYVVNVNALDTLDFLDSWYTPGGPVADSSGATPVDVTAADASGIDLTPLSGFSISGTVTGASSGPLAGVEVFANGAASGLTDRSGHYTLHHVADGTYQLGEFMASDLNFVSGSVDSGVVVRTGPGSDVVVSGASLTGQDFVVPRGFRITGTLTGPEAAGATVSPFGAPDCTCTGVTIAPNGSWQILGLWPDAYQLAFGTDNPLDSQFPLGYWAGTSTLTSSESLAAPIVVSSADRTGINAAIPVGVSVSGSATGSDGAIGAGSWVEMCGGGGLGCAAMLTNGGGGWSFTHVPAGSYQVQAFEHAHVATWFGPGGSAVSPALATTIAVGSTSRTGVNVVLPAGVGISGRISGPSDEPIVGAHVDEFPGGISPAGAGGASGADGTYRVAGNPAGDYGLFVGPPTPSPYLSGYYDAAAPGHFSLDGNQATMISIGDGVGSSYVPITPLRVVDSRTPLGVDGILHAGIAKSFPVGGFSPIPPDATAVTGNVTVVGQNAPGFVAITPVATSSPSSSTLNFPVGDVRANNFTTPLAGDGSLAVVYIAAGGATAHVVVDITGYFETGSSHAVYDPISPARVLDTRPTGNVGLAAPFKANVPRQLTVGGTHGIPADAVAITGNLTVVGQTNPGFLAVTPARAVAPTSSTLNFPVGDVRANGLTVALSGGTLWIVYKAAAGTTDVVLDVTGYYTTTAAGLLFYPLPPGRLVDTRFGVLATALSGPFAAGGSRTFATAGRAGIPLGAAAITGNLTVVGQSAPGFAALTAAPTSSPTTSTLNFPAGDIRANGITSPLSPDGNAALIFEAVHGARTQLLLDITGYFQ